MTDLTTLDLYRHEVDNPRPAHYLHYVPGGRRELSTEEFFARTAALATALEELGVGHGDRVMLLADNRPEWHVVDLATADLGAILVPVYSTLTPTQVEYQAKDSGAVIAVAESPEHMAKFREVVKTCPSLAHLIQIEGQPIEGAKALDDIIAGTDGDKNGDLFWQRAAKVTEDDLLTLIYTSGTTGNPKGVMLTHRNLVQNVLASAERAPVDPDALALEFLPLCHVFERMVGYIFMYRSVRKAYCSVYHVGDLVAEIAPNAFAGVPRFYEKVHDKIMDMVGSAPAIRRALFNWALGVGQRAIPARLAGRQPSGLAFALADKLVLSKVRMGLGGRVKFCISGGAPLPLFVNEFFHAIGIDLIEGYGLTETSPVIAVNGTAANECQLGTVGRALSNLEVATADDGELMVKGPSVMKGYWNLPEKTAEVFDENGFFHTGDIAEIQTDGFIRITDRKKDLIVTGGGKNIAPQPIENELKRSQYIDNAVLIGDRRPFVVALLSPNTEALEKWAGQHGAGGSTVAELSGDPRVVALFQETVDQVNAGLARYEQIKKFAVLPLMLSMEGGHLTPTLKVKRRVVEKEYADLIDGLYSE
ncbi:MAG: long-chain fatty acid--CoA ligase [Acidobacteria bacterium]|nr:long-chain fatty acid--CoA ligase [Acidobacteriota bacterium]